MDGTNEFQTSCMWKTKNNHNLELKRTKIQGADHRAETVLTEMLNDGEISNNHSKYDVDTQWVFLHSEVRLQNAGMNAPSFTQRRRKPFTATVFKKQHTSPNKNKQPIQLFLSTLP